MEGGLAKAARTCQSVGGRMALCGLPDVLLLEIALCVMNVELRDALRLCQACKQLLDRLNDVHVQALQRRLQWLDRKANSLTVSGRVVTTKSRTYAESCRDTTDPWMSGGLLPNIGRISWRIRVEHGDMGDMIIGVCNAASTHAWGLDIRFGMLYRCSRNADGSRAGNCSNRPPPPDGWPDGHMSRIMVNEAGRPFRLEWRAEGAIIEVILDMEDGSRAFRVVKEGSRPSANMAVGRLLCVPNGFRLPAGAQLRPWVRLYGSGGDSLSFVRPYLSVSVPAVAN